ncbi:Kinase domain-containing protein [Aspergillus sp. HF37]|nr:Kinase domain-containing protein [Aspergillus sp. HF37]
MTTDIQLANILLRLPLDMQGMTLEQLHARTSEPAKERVVRKDGAPLDPGVPSEVIVPVWLGLGSDEISLADSGIMIADFGEAFEPRLKRQFTAHTPLLLSPPESRFAYPGGSDEPLSFPGDIWMLACTTWDVFGSGPLFEAFPVTLDEATIEHVEMLGRLPDRWWCKGEDRNNWFDEDGRKNVKESLCQWYGNSARSQNQRFTEYIQRPREMKRFDKFSIEGEKAFCDMMTPMLMLEPSERATTEEVVGCEVDTKMGSPRNPENAG